MSKKFVVCMIFVTFIFSLGVLTCVAGDAQLKVIITPAQSQVFIDGKPMGQAKAKNTFTMSPGKHTIGAYSYGFKPLIKEINAEPGFNPTIEATLQAIPGTAPGPFGVLMIKEADQSAVLLNGKTPEFYVGHGDMFNNHIWWKQQLLVPPGTHEVTVMKGDQVLFSGPVKVNQNERTILRVGSGTTEVKSWAEGTTIGAQPRFTVGTASATVAIVPVNGTLAAEPKLIHCNDPVKVSWDSTETLHAYLSAEPGMAEEEVPLSGNRTFEPKVDTKYTFRSVGPGGWVTKAVTVKVNPEVKASLSSSAEPAHYILVGDKILNQDATQLTWSTNWADKVMVEPFGTVAPNGTQSFKPTPKSTGPGAIDELQNFKLTATNVCGGSDTRIATVLVMGVQEPVLTSVFFPTKFPLKAHLDDGLLISQQKELLKLVDVFKLYAQHNPDAKLVLMGNADPRDHSKRNLKLSERRVELVRNYLYVQGIPKDKIEIQALGDEKPLSPDTIRLLEAANPSATGKDSDSRETRMAYDRRVDVVVMPVGLETAKIYPHNAEDSPVLGGLNVPNHLVVEKNQ